MKSCPTHAVEPCKIHNGFDTAGSRFKNTSAELVPLVFDRVQVRQRARPWKTSDVLLIFVFLDDASTVRSCNVISEHRVHCLYRASDRPFLEVERTTQDGGPFNTVKVGVSLYTI